MPDYPTREFIVRETGYPGATKQDVVGELVRCIDCKHRHDGLECRYEGTVMAKTPPRCDRMFGFIDDDGWCYKGERKDT